MRFPTKLSLRSWGTTTVQEELLEGLKQLQMRTILGLLIMILGEYTPKPYSN